MAKKKYSYIKYPYSQNGWFSFILSLVSFVLTVLVAVIAIRSGGNTDLFAATLGFTAVVMSFAGLWFTYITMTEREKNRLFAYIGGGISFFLTLAWVFVIGKAQG